MTTPHIEEKRTGSNRGSRTGNLYHNPVTTERATILVSAAESNGELVRAELWVPPRGRVAAPHVHPGQSERYEILAGRLGIQNGGEVSTALPGDCYEINPGAVHDWWTEGDEPAHVIVEVRPALRFEEMIMTLWGLAAAGRTNAKGMPNLLQLALLGPEWDDDVRFVSPPRWVQRGITYGLGSIARRRGLKGAYPELEERILIGRIGEALTLTGSEPFPVG